MKKFICVLFSMFLIIPVNAKIITGEIEYNAESAAQEVFAEQPEIICFEFIKKHLIDRNRDENLLGLAKGRNHYEGRKAAYFSDNTYGIIYDDDPEYTWFYQLNGRLISFTCRSTLDFPAKITRYMPDGTIKNIGLKVSENESFIYSPEGKLLAHWLGTNCYDEFNNIIMTRKYK